MKTIVKELAKKRRKHFQLMNKYHHSEYMHGFHSGYRAGIDFAIQLIKEDPKWEK
jgi:hypothetical protein